MVGLYKIFVVLIRGVCALITFFADTPVSGARPPPFIAHAITQNIRVPTRPPFIATHHTILVIAISCKGEHHGPVQRILWRAAHGTRLILASVYICISHNQSNKALTHTHPSFALTLFFYTYIFFFERRINPPWPSSTKPLASGTRHPPYFVICVYWHFTETKKQSSNTYKAVLLSNTLVLFCFDFLGGQRHYGPIQRIGRRAPQGVRRAAEAFQEENQANKETDD